MVRIIGADEVGTGSFAGPIYVCAYATPDEFPEWWQWVRDSKKLSKNAREALFPLLTAPGQYWYATTKSADYINRFGLARAVGAAMQEVVIQLIQRVPDIDPSVYIDGQKGFDVGTPITHGEDAFKEIAAASIVAKVLRDTYMKQLGTVYPDYHWAKNVGYGTNDHREAILKYGITPEHRRVKWIRERFA